MVHQQKERTESGLLVAVVIEAQKRCRELDVLAKHVGVNGIRLDTLLEQIQRREPAADIRRTLIEEITEYAGEWLDEIVRLRKELRAATSVQAPSAGASAGEIEELQYLRIDVESLAQRLRSAQQAHDAQVSGIKQSLEESTEQKRVADETVASLTSLEQSLRKIVGEVDRVLNIQRAPVSQAWLELRRATLERVLKDLKGNATAYETTRQKYDQAVARVRKSYEDRLKKDYALRVVHHEFQIIGRVLQRVGFPLAEWTGVNPSYLECDPTDTLEWRELQDKACPSFPAAPPAEMLEKLVQATLEDLQQRLAAVVKAVRETGTAAPASPVTEEARDLALRLVVATYVLCYSGGEENLEAETAYTAFTRRAITCGVSRKLFLAAVAKAEKRDLLRPAPRGRGLTATSAADGFMDTPGFWLAFPAGFRDKLSSVLKDLVLPASVPTGESAPTSVVSLPVAEAAAPSELTPERIALVVFAAICARMKSGEPHPRSRRSIRRVYEEILLPEGLTFGLRAEEFQEAVKEAERQGLLRHTMSRWSNRLGWSALYQPTREGFDTAEQLFQRAATDFPDRLLARKRVLQAEAQRRKREQGSPAEDP